MKNLYFATLTVGLIFVGSLAQAAPCSILSPAERAVIGTTCETSHGAFKRVDVPALGEAWQDMKLGTIWGSRMQPFFTQDEAKSACAVAGATLPSENDFRQAYLNDITELFADDSQPREYSSWSWLTGDGTLFWESDDISTTNMVYENFWFTAKSRHENARCILKP